MKAAEIAILIGAAGAVFFGLYKFGAPKARAASPSSQVADKINDQRTASEKAFASTLADTAYI